MCGIAGMVGDFVPGLAARMNAAQKHRGPDGDGVFENPAHQVALAHVRLSILDLSDQAAQPMRSPDGRFVLAFNGEIYNFADLRESCRRDAWPLRSSGDTEVLLQGLATEGKSFVRRLNGIFAFALWDDREQSLLLARDPVGVKPLYYATPRPGVLIFASEIKAICASPGFAREPDFHAIQQHLSFCHSCSDRTALRGVHRLPPGSTLSWNARDRRFVIEAYWKAEPRAQRWKSRSEAAEALRETVAQSVRRQLVSDVPVGAFLSGGLDSSLITSLASKYSADKFRSYTITYPRSSNSIDQFRDDAPYARRLARKLDLDFHEIEIGPQLTSLLPRLVHLLDEPLADPAAITSFLICRLARRHGTKVLLSGQGADELFGGYPRHAVMQKLGWSDQLPRPLRRFVARGSALLPGAMAGRTGAALRRVRRVLTDIDRPAPDRFLAYCMATPPRDVRRILRYDVAHSLAGVGPADDCRGRLLSGPHFGMGRFLDRDFSVYLPNHNLLYTDKMGMAVGLEARVPLLDLDVVEAALSMPDEWKLRPTTKSILRDAARGVIPDEIIDRPKAGFGAPFRHWLRHDLAEMWDDLMSARSIRDRGWFDPRSVERIRTQSRSGKEDTYMLQWSLLTLELWSRAFLDRNPADQDAVRRPAVRIPTIAAPPRETFRPRLASTAAPSVPSPETLTRPDKQEEHSPRRQRRPIVRWLDRKLYPDYVDSWDDCQFRNRILGAIESDWEILELGAGAGVVRQMNFRGLVHRVCGIDPDERVLANPALNEARIAVGESIPYHDEAFDLVFADNVLEHLEVPSIVFAEVWRTLKPGGVFLFKTPNKWHYVPTLARLTPHVFHQAYNRLRGRRCEDTFPTRYRANTPATIRRIAAESGFDVESLSLIEGRPEYLRIAWPAYLAGWLYERTVNAIELLHGFRVVMIGALRKPDVARLAPSASEPAVRRKAA